ncbi:hypothetical protein ACS0TY_010880 [Phlomoides rotata]
MRHLHLPHANSTTATRDLTHVTEAILCQILLHFSKGFPKENYMYFCVLFVNVMCNHITSTGRCLWET